MVFSSHLARGLGLPVSSFFLNFLNFYGLQPHHLGANSIMQLGCFVMLCEAYVGIWTCLEIFIMLFYLRTQTTDGKLHECGCISIYMKNSVLPKIHLPDSVKKWQGSYFYVRNLTEVDRIGLSAFSNAPLADKSWGRKVLSDGALEEAMMSRLKQLVASGLTSRDLTLAWVSRRLLEL